MAAAHTILVVPDAHQPRIFEHLQMAQRYIRRIRIRLENFRVVDDVVRNQGRHRQRQLPFFLQVVHRALDDVDGRAAGDFRIGLDVGDEQLDRRQVRRNRPAEVFGQVRRKQAGMLGARRVDDEIGRREALAHSRVQRNHAATGSRATARAARSKGPPALPDRARTAADRSGRRPRSGSAVWRRRFRPRSRARRDRARARPEMRSCRR